MKKLSKIFVSVIAALVFSDWAMACPSYIPFDPALAGPFTNTIHVDDYLRQKSVNETNLEEWRKYLGVATDAEDDCLHVVNELSSGHFESVKKIAEAFISKTAVSSGEGDLKKAESDFKKFVETYFSSPEKKEALDYFVLAVASTRFVRYEKDGWTTVTEEEAENCRALSGRFLSLLPNVKSEFVKSRISFQLVRLARFRKDYQAAVDLYNGYFVENSRPCLAKALAMEQAAASFYYLERLTDANRLYLKMAFESPALRAKAVMRILVRTQAEWDELLASCASDKERAYLYAMRALDNISANRLYEMREIGRLDPQNPLLTAIMVRETRWIEQRALSGDDVSAILKEDIALVAQLLPGIPKRNRPVWDLCLYYMEWLSGKKPEQKGLDQFKVNFFLDRLAVSATIANFNLPDDDLAYAMIERTSGDIALKKLVFYKLARIYGEAGEMAKASILRAIMDDEELLAKNRDPKLFSRLEELVEKKDKSRFEEYLLGSSFHFYYYGEPHGNVLGTSLYMLGCKAVEEERYEDALSYFERLNPDDWETKSRMGLSFDPFEVRVNDYGYGWREKPVTDKISAVKRLIELKKLSQGEGKEAATALMELGIAFYNISSFGRSTTLQTPFFGREMISNTAIFSDPIFDLSKSRVYLQRAEKMLAPLDKEAAAKCSFMLAKIKWAESYKKNVGKDEKDKVEIDFSERPQSQFAAMKEAYSDTAFYAQAVKECKTFERWSRMDQ